MQDYLSTQEVARRLGIAPEDVAKLISQGILRPRQQRGASYYFASEDIGRITNNKGPTLSEQAAQVNTQIHQEMFFSVATLQKLRRRLSVASLAAAAVLVVSVITTALLFNLYPEQMSDFFGYYYRFNKLSDTTVLPVDAASLDSQTVADNPAETSVKTSVLADVLKPVAASSLVVVKAFDVPQYQRIVTPPSQVSGGQTGPPGARGPSGLPGVNGRSGLAGLPGLTGTQGSSGTKGSNGLNGIDGVSGRGGTSVADVTTTPGDLIIRNANNLVARLGTGTNNQVLTVLGGIPAWANPQGLTAEADTLATVTARGATTATPVNLSSMSNDLTAGTLRMNGDVLHDLTGSGLAVVGGVLRVAGLTNANLSGAAGISNANLAHSGLTVNGNSGSAAVALGGGLTLTGAGITRVTASGSVLTVSSTEADTLASVTARGATTPGPISVGGLSVAGSVTLPGLLNCKRLTTSAAGALQCAPVTPAAARFTDVTPAVFADNDTGQLFNDATKPNITPEAASQAVLVSVHVRFTSGGRGDTDAAVRIVRNIGSAAGCSAGSQVGDSFSALMMRAGDSQDASGTFLDLPATTTPVFYTVCSSANSQLKRCAPTVDRVDVTLVKIGL